MGMVHGVGAAKLEQYGEAFLTVVKRHLSGDVRADPSEA
jgi:superfamily II DNA helicase RecQ